MRNDETSMPFVEFPNSHLADRDASMLGSILKPKTRQTWNEAWADAFFFLFFFLWPRRRQRRKPKTLRVFPRAASQALYYWRLFKIFLVNLPNKWFSCHFPFFWKEEWKERYCIVTRVFPLEGFFFLIIWMPADLGPRPGRQHFYIYVCWNVLKTLRRMINIKVFYKKVYNHLDIYTNTQIYIHIYVYIFYNMAIEKSCNYVSNYLIINHIGLERRLNSNNKS